MIKIIRFFGGTNIKGLPARPVYSKTVKSFQPITKSAMTNTTMYAKLEYNVHNAFTRLPRSLRESSCDCDFEIFSANADSVFSKEAGELSSRYE